MPRPFHETISEFLLRASRRSAGCAFWLVLCTGVTLIVEQFSHDFLMANVLTLHQALFEMTAIPAVAAWFLRGIGVMLLVSAWWRPLRGTFCAVLIAMAIGGTAYGVGTLWYGPAVGFRPADGTLRLLFIVSVALPGMLRIVGFRLTAVAGLLGVIIIGVVSAFRPEIFDLYTRGVRLVAWGVSITPWIAGWISYETFAAIRRAIHTTQNHFDDEYSVLGFHPDSDLEDTGQHP